MPLGMLLHTSHPALPATAACPCQPPPTHPIQYSAALRLARNERYDAARRAFEAVVALAGHKMAETDPELGANLMVFFFRDWAELPEVPNLDRLVPGLADLCDKLAAAEANQYRIFRFDEAGAIKAAFVFLRMDAHLSAVSAETLALSQAVQTILLWSDVAFMGTSPLAQIEGRVILRPDIAGVIRAAYDRVLPAVARDASHALRLAARVAAAH